MSEPDHSALGPGPEPAASAGGASPTVSPSVRKRRAHAVTSRSTASRWAVVALVIAFYAGLFALAGPAAFVAALVVGAVGMALVGARGSGSARARLR
ncbi:hypothetical protein [Demequina sp. SO4-18]|uniref:hypothetical protein n=1 Tax=Demequina sp. SO4-18 TaxID=3401026 RepID=UPI003B5B2C86